MQFEYPEDRQFFADLLAEGDVDRLETAYSDLFDFRHPAIKRFEFNKTRKKVLAELMEKHNGECQLRIHPECSNGERMEPDHIIPLSSNTLNKELRGMKRYSSAKVEPQSFGSNHARNLTLACRKCNGLKKHRILSGLSERLIKHPTLV
jgi:5-methylcytosine-specific restriction endonuclease McrA